MPKYDAQYFIEKFEKIPEEMWYRGAFEDPCRQERKCALGHCGWTYYGFRAPVEAEGLIDLFAEHLLATVESVNDIQMEPFNQPTPRARILAACRLLKEQGH